jgi:carboxypeptidase C (cathepsin A)
MKIRWIILCQLFLCPLYGEALKGETAKSEAAKPAPKEETVTTSGSVAINGVQVKYTATAGTQLLNDDKGAPKATFFYVAYTKDGVEDLKDRPVTFCFNGGPGSSSVWLHLGVLGPKRVNISQDGLKANSPSYLVDNPYSILDLTDLVFVDPVSTGYSRAVDDPKEYHGVEGDVESVAEFIRLYATRNLRWESPKYLAGESYGTTRAAGLAEELHNKHYFYLDGVLLLSTVLNFQTIDFSSGNDLAYILFLPTYTQTALYHNRLSAEMQKDPKKTQKEVEHFALNDYATALIKGSALDPAKRKEVLGKLSGFTGLSEEYLDRSDLRVHIFRFAKELLASKRRIVGRFDSRVTAIDCVLCSDMINFDPSFDLILGIFTDTFNTYVRKELDWKKDEPYKILTSLSPWNYTPANNKYLDVSGKLTDVMNRNERLKVFVASGMTDLATPYFTTAYTFSHLNLDPLLRDNITIKYYEGGHMMYLNEPTLVQMKKDITAFFKSN